MIIIIIVIFIMSIIINIITIIRTISVNSILFANGRYCLHQFFLILSSLSLLSKPRRRPISIETEEEEDGILLRSLMIHFIILV